MIHVLIAWRFRVEIMFVFLWYSHSDRRFLWRTACTYQPCRKLRSCSSAEVAQLYCSIMFSTECLKSLVLLCTAAYDQRTSERTTLSTFLSRTCERISEFRLHEPADLVELCTIHCTTTRFLLLFSIVFGPHDALIHWYSRKQSLESYPVERRSAQILICLESTDFHVRQYWDCTHIPICAELANIAKQSSAALAGTGAIVLQKFCLQLSVVSFFRIFIFVFWSSSCEEDRRAAWPTPNF